MPVTLAPERLVNTVTDGAQRPGDVAISVRTASVWIDESSGSPVAKLRVFERDGSPVGGEVAIGAATDVVVTPTAGGYVVVRVVQVGAQQVDIVAQTYGVDGQPLGGAVTLDTTDVRNTPILGYSSRGLEATPLSDGGYIVGWSNSSFDSGGRSSVSAEYVVVGAQGAIEGRDGLTSVSGRAVGGNDAEVAFTELASGQILATFRLLPAFLAGPPPEMGQYARILDAAGQPLGPAFKLDPGFPSDGGPRLDGTGSVAVEALASGDIAFAWVSNGSMWMSIYDGERLLQGDSSVRTPPVRLGSGDPQIVELPDGRFVVGYSANDDVLAQVFSATGQPEGAAFHLGTVFQGTQDGVRLFAGSDGVVAALWEDRGNQDDPSGSGVKLELTAFAQALQGGAGRDTLAGGPTGDVLSGLAGDDVLLGQGGGDTLLGGMGGDSLIGAAGDDRLDGGLNTDFVSYADAAAAVTIDLTGLFASGGGGSDQLIAIEAAYGSHFNDMLIGNYLSNLLVGDLGADTVEGMAGSNYLDGGPGSDLVELVGAVSDYFVTDVTATGARVIGPYGVDQILNFERVRIGGTEIGWQDFTAQAFNGLRYVASNPDLIASIGTDVERARQHWLNTGRAEGRSLDSFDPLRYAASNPDLGAQFYIDTAALSRHFIQTGHAEGRSAVSFDPLQYGAANADLLLAFGADPAALTRHYAVAGVAENRPKTGFDPLLYGASNDDLARVFGTDADALFQHWIIAGVYEGRDATGFDPVAYLLSNPDLPPAGVTVDTAIDHWLTVGADQGRRGDELFGREQATHAIENNLVSGQLTNFATSGRPSADRDWYEISVGGSTTFRVAARGADSGHGTLADPRIEVYDASGRLVASDEDGGQGRDALVEIVNGGPPAQRSTYYIVVRSTGEGEGTYDVSLDFGFQGASAPGWVV